MSTYTLKSVVRRGTMLGFAAALALATVLPAASTYADALNPLTNRSLTLSSSSPGWSYTDGSGNGTYAYPNSGANGQKTGNTFQFKTSTNSSSTKTVKAFTFQYCTTPAGQCTGPGNGAFDVATEKSNLSVQLGAPSELTPAAFGQIIDSATGLPKTDSARPTIVVPGTANASYKLQGIPHNNGSEGNFVVLYKQPSESTWTQSTGWAMRADVKQDTASTGEENFITITNAAGGLATASATDVKIIFYATDSNYITNPGGGAFFVKINDYSVATADGTLDATSPDLIDGGVTVANVMNQSIEIQTKVLETMAFSVGTVDPYTLDSTDGVDSEFADAHAGTRTQHGLCDPVLQGMLPTDRRNTLQLGDQAGENSLSTDVTYSTHSYWRLSSNSSAGATVYYSGVTLKNTVGDEIKAIGTTATAPSRGTPQFGLALANGTIAQHGTAGNTDSGATTTGLYPVNYSKEDNAINGLFENGADRTTAGLHATVATDIATQGLTSAFHEPRLYPLIPTAQYDRGAGIVNGAVSTLSKPGYGTPNTLFAFDPDSNTIPAALASESNQVVDCVTGKMRYIANIAATTPAGIYTTKINYIAAPQY